MVKPLSNIKKTKNKIKRKNNSLFNNGRSKTITQTTLFRVIATVGILGTILYNILTNTRTAYVQIIQALFFVTLWIVLIIDRYQHKHSKSYLKWDLFLVGVSALLLVAIISFFR